MKSATEVMIETQNAAWRSPMRKIAGFDWPATRIVMRYWGFDPYNTAEYFA